MTNPEIEIQKRYNAPKPSSDLTKAEVVRASQLIRLDGLTIEQAIAKVKAER